MQFHSFPMHLKRVNRGKGCASAGSASFSSQPSEAPNNLLSYLLCNINEHLLKSISILFCFCVSQPTNSIFSLAFQSIERRFPLVKIRVKGLCSSDECFPDNRTCCVGRKLRRENIYDVGTEIDTVNSRESYAIKQ